MDCCTGDGVAGGRGPALKRARLHPTARRRKRRQAQRPLWRPRLRRISGCSATAAAHGAWLPAQHWPSVEADTREVTSPPRTSARTAAAQDTGETLNAIEPSSSGVPERHRESCAT